MKNEHIELLKKILLFKDFDDEQLRILLRHLEFNQYEANTQLITQGQYNEKLFIINSGKTAITIHLPGDTYRELAQLGPGDFFGEIAMLSNLQTTATVKTLSDTECFIIKREIIEMLKIADPALANVILHSIAKLAFDRIANVIIKTHQLLSQIDTSALYSPITMLKRSANEKQQRKTAPVVEPKMLREMGILKVLTSKEINQLMTYARIHDYDKGIEIYNTTSEDEYCALVYSGAVQLHDEHISKLCLVGPGELFGQLRIIGGKKLMSAIARENTILIEFTKPRLDEMRYDNIDLWYKFQEIMYENTVTFLYLIDRQLIRLEGELGQIIEEKA